jgi:hypothetical protein
MKSKEITILGEVQDSNAAGTQNPLSRDNHQELHMDDDSDGRILKPRIHFATVSEMHLGMEHLKDKTLDSRHSLPWIPVLGQWLDKAGFKIDEHVELEIVDRRIVITAV